MENKIRSKRIVVLMNLLTVNIHTRHNPCQKIRRRESHRNVYILKTFTTHLEKIQVTSLNYMDSVFLLEYFSMWSLKFRTCFLHFRHLIYLQDAFYFRNVYGILSLSCVSSSAAVKPHIFTSKELFKRVISSKYSI